MAEPFARACPRLGIEVVVGGSDSIPKARDFDALARKIAASGADTTFYGGIIPSGAGRLWIDVKSSCPGMRMMAADAIFERAFLADAEGSAEGTLITFGGVPPAHLSGRGASFYERYKQTYGKEPESYAASTYDAVSAVLGAIERVARKDRAAVCGEVLATRDYAELLGRWGFDTNGDITLRRISRISVERGDFAFLGAVEVPEDAVQSHPSNMYSLASHAARAST